MRDRHIRFTDTEIAACKMDVSTVAPALGVDLRLPEPFLPTLHVLLRPGARPVLLIVVLPPPRGHQAAAVGDANASPRPRPGPTESEARGGPRRLVIASQVLDACRNLTTSGACSVLLCSKGRAPRTPGLGRMFLQEVLLL